MTYVWDPYYNPNGGVYGGRNGSYGWHGDESPPVPYKGRVYTIQSNALVAFSPENTRPTELPLAQTVEPQNPSPRPITTTELKNQLTEEVQKIVAAGHLNPGWQSAGLFDHKGKPCVESSVDYWHHPSEVILTLISVLPHLPPVLAQETRDYIQSEFESYPPYQFNHIGWNSGNPREPFDFPPEVVSGMSYIEPQSAIYDYDGWRRSPLMFYVLWKYVELFGDAEEIYNNSKDKIETAPSNAYLLDMPHVHNAFIAGYLGYLELENLAGFSETTSIKKELNRLLALRSSGFSKDSPDLYFEDKKFNYCRAMNSSRNFIYMVPELAKYLRQNNFSQVQEAINEYDSLTPYWFVSKLETVYGEGSMGTQYDYPSIFAAKTWILELSQDELTKYLDVPAVEVGDLYHIQNLVLAIESENNP
jgi:hypothetical protein